MKSFNNKTWMMGVVTATLLVAVMIPSLPFASATQQICFSIIEGVTFDNLLVEANTPCTLRNVSVIGNVVIESGASLTALQSSIGGNVQADGSNFITLAVATVGGSVVIKNMDNGVESVNIDDSEIVGNLEFDNNSVMFVWISGSTIGGNVQLAENTANEISVKFNTIGGDLQFSKNISDTMLGQKIIDNIIDKDLIFFKNRAECVFDTTGHWTTWNFCFGSNMGNQIIDNDIGGNLLSFDNEVFGADFTKGNQVINNKIDGNLQFFENNAADPEGFMNENNKIVGNDIGGNLDCANQNSVIDFEGGNTLSNPNAQSGDCLGAPAIVEICHMGTTTLSVPTNVVIVHFAHGDVLGACEN